MQLTVSTTDTPTRVHVGSTYAGRSVKATEVTIGPVRVTDKSKAEGKRRAQAQLQTWLDAYTGPTVVTWERHTAVLVQMPTDNTYERISVSEIITGPDASVEGGVYRFQSHAGYQSMEEAKRRALVSMITHNVDHLDDASVFAAFDVLEGRRLREEATELLRRAAWQRAARHAIDAGMQDYHAWACEHERDAEFIPVREEVPA